MLRDVLIVEDEPVVARSAARILEGAGLAVRLAEDAPSAIAQLDQADFRVVLCDLMLPGDSGFSVLEAARDRRPLAQVVMVTGFATCENALLSFKSGAFDFLPKPFDVDELLAVITRALSCFDLAQAGGREENTTGSNAGHAFADSTEIYFLGRHTWAATGSDGSTTLGLGETFPGLLGPTEKVELPQPDQHIRQCRRCALIRGRENLEHRAWAPLSGRVIAVNGALEADPGRLDREPWEACWLLRIVPESPAEELSNLVRH